MTVRACAYSEIYFERCAFSLNVAVGTPGLTGLTRKETLPDFSEAQFS